MNADEMTSLFNDYVIGKRKLEFIDFYQNVHVDNKNLIKNNYKQYSTRYLTCFKPRRFFTSIYDNIRDYGGIHATAFCLRDISLAATSYYDYKTYDLDIYTKQDIDGLINDYTMREIDIFGKSIDLNINNADKKFVKVNITHDISKPVFIIPVLCFELIDLSSIKTNNEINYSVNLCVYNKDEFWGFYDFRNKSYNDENFLIENMIPINKLGLYDIWSNFYQEQGTAFILFDSVPENLTITYDAYIYNHNEYEDYYKINNNF